MLSLGMHIAAFCENVSRQYVSSQAIQYVLILIIVIFSCKTCPSQWFVINLQDLQ